MSQTATSAFAGASGAGSAYTTGMPKRKQASVVEMLEYVKSLNIDPIREADMLWIAEEAFNAPLPPGWTEHQDEQGRAYFHNASSGESTWKHPMDDLFREIVDYQRRVVEVGGFWQVEDEIAEQEENIRKDLADWMELFAEDGEKFFYNRHTEESRFDDPRMAVYHVLYARIKMVARMKERFPILARQPRPEEPTEAEKDLRRRKEEEKEHYLSCLLRIQTWGRVLLAKRRLAVAREQAIVQKGPQPLRGMLRLRMERIGPSGSKELVLSQTTPAKRHRAATKIQKRIRGILTRKRFQPVVRHRCFLSKEMTKIQAMARIWLARRQVARVKQQRLHLAATKIQRVWRAYRDRQYVTALRAEKERYNMYMRSTRVIQGGVRMALARREFMRRKLTRLAQSASRIQSQVKIYFARKELHELDLRETPIQASFALNLNPKNQRMLPWSWRVFMAPWAGKAPGEPAESEEFVDIFKKVGVNNWDTVAAVHCQKLARGFLTRTRAQRTKTIATGAVRGIVENALKVAARRRRCAIKIQSVFRGWLVRRTNLICHKREAARKANMTNAAAVQVFLKRHGTPDYEGDVLDLVIKKASTMMQTAWRGYMARRLVDQLREEALWPVKGWFEYTATGREAVQVEVCFLPNPSFDDYKYFLTHGSTSALQLSLEELEADLASAMTSIQGNHFLREDPFRRDSKSSKASKDRDSKARSSSRRPVREESKNPRSQESEAEKKPDKKQESPSKSKSKSASRKQAESTGLDEAPQPENERSDEASKEPSKKPSRQASPESPQKGKTASPKKKPKGTEDATSEAASKDPSAKAKAKAEPRKEKARSEDKQASAVEEGVKVEAPPAMQPKPPTLDPHSSAKEMSQSTQANALRKSQSAGAVAAPNPEQGKNYAGTVKNGKFEKRKVDSIEALNKDEKAALIADIEREKREKMEAIAEKMKLQVKRKQQQEAKKQQAQRSQMEQAEAIEEERRKDKVKELKKWLKQKEEQERSKKEKDAAVMQEIQDKELLKQEQQKLLEQERQEQRDRRLEAVAKQKAKLEAQLLASREAAKQEKQAASQRSEAASKISKGSQEASQAPLEAEESDPRMRRQQLMIQQQMAQPSYPAQPAQGMAQRIVHRHIHHHVHYHEGDDEEGAIPLPSIEERRRIEQASENRIKQQLAQEGLPMDPMHVDPTAQTPTMQQSRSMPSLQSGMGITKTQEAFRPHQLPQIDHAEVGRKHGVPNFGTSVGRAVQSYADSGRPRFVKSGMAPPR